MKFGLRLLRGSFCDGIILLPVGPHTKCEDSVNMSVLKVCGDELAPAPTHYLGFAESVWCRGRDSDFTLSVFL